MVAKQNLVDAYASWEQLTRREGVAIQESNWRRVHECQKVKRELQSRIIELTEAANAECAEAGVDPKVLEPDLRRIINNLIVLETRNAELLASRRQAAAAKKNELDRASRNLRRVKKSYIQPSGDTWHSYS